MQSVAYHNSRGSVLQSRAKLTPCKNVKQLGSAVERESSRKGDDMALRLSVDG